MAGYQFFHMLEVNCSMSLHKSTTSQTVHCSFPSFLPSPPAPPPFSVFLSLLRPHPSQLLTHSLSLLKWGTMKHSLAKQVEDFVFFEEKPEVWIEKNHSSGDWDRNVRREISNGESSVGLDLTLQPRLAWNSITQTELAITGASASLVLPLQVHASMPS